MDKKKLKIIETEEDKINTKPKKWKKRKTQTLRSNIRWDTNGVELNHFFDFKNNRLIFYNQAAGYLAWREKGITEGINGDWIHEVEWVECFDDHFFILSLNEKSLSLYQKSFSPPDVILLKTVPLETRSYELYEKVETSANNVANPTNVTNITNIKTTNLPSQSRIIKKEVINTNVDRAFDLSYPTVLAAKASQGVISFLFSDHRLIIFEGENFNTVHWIEMRRQLLEKAEESHTYFHQIFLTELPWFIYITFKQFSPKGLEAVLVDYVDIKSQTLKKSYQLKMDKQSFMAIENHRFITAAYIKNKKQYNFYYKSLRHEENFIRSIPLSTHLPGTIVPYQMKAEGTSIIGYYLKNNRIELFEWN